MAIEKTLINKATYESKMDELKAALDNYSNPEAVHLNDTQTITGLKTFATLPQAGTDPSNDADFVPKRYVDDIVSTRKAQEEKCYQALKTVTKDFTHTDPVYVRIGEDGEPEIHYTFTTYITESKFFALMNLGNASLFLHNGIFCQSIEQMFAGTVIRKITFPDDFAPNDIAVMFNGSSVGEINSFDISNVAIGWSVFAYATKLESIPDFDMSSISSLNGWFDGCKSLTSFHATGMKVSFDLSSTALNHDAILEVFNNLGTVDASAGITLTLGSAKLALMSDEEKAIATGKGWVLA